MPSLVVIGPKIKEVTQGGGGGDFGTFYQNSSA